MLGDARVSFGSLAVVMHTTATMLRFYERPTIGLYLDDAGQSGGRTRT